MHAVEDELPVPRAVMAALSELYSPDEAPEAFTVRHPLGVEVREVQDTPAIVNANTKDETANFMLPQMNCCHGCIPLSCNGGKLRLPRMAVICEVSSLIRWASGGKGLESVVFRRNGAYEKRRELQLHKPNHEDPASWQECKCEWKNYTRFTLYLEADGLKT